MVRQVCKLKKCVAGTGDNEECGILSSKKCNLELYIEAFPTMDILDFDITTEFVSRTCSKTAFENIVFRHIKKWMWI